MKRIDVYLVDLNLAQSRTAAQHLIDAGRVLVTENGVRKAITKASQKIEVGTTVEIVPSEEEEFVSRGGIKLKGALNRTKINVQNFLCLDVGISTGGFSDCLLRSGARAIVGIDVGHKQLSPLLQNNPHITLLEGINARKIEPTEILCFTNQELFDLIVIDVSFISLTHILTSVLPLLKKEGHLLALVKPQFEVGPDGLAKNGIVKNERLFAEVEQKIREHLGQLGFAIRDYFASPIAGGDGNREFFVWAQRFPSSGS